MVNKRTPRNASYANLRSRAGRPSEDGLKASATFAEKISSGKSGVIKVSGKGSALRQFVAKAKAEATPRPVIKLRAPDRSARTDMLVPIVGGRPQFENGLVEPMSASERRSFLSSAAQLGEFVRGARLRQRLTQTELAEKAGTGRRFISELEAGKPTAELERVLQVCNALGVRLLAAEHNAS